jgi:hypothetical protein
MFGGDSFADGSVVAYTTHAPAPVVVSAKYGSANCNITIASYPVGCLVETFGIHDPVANIPGWNPNALVDKIVDGPPALQGKWLGRNAVKGCGPEKYMRDDHAVRDIKNTTTTKYPSRTEVEIKNHQVVLVNFCTRKVVD